MFLYDNKGDYIDVYKLEPKLDDIKKYRKKEMSKIPRDKRCWIACTNDSSLKLLELCDDTISNGKLNFRDRRYDVDIYHKFCSDFYDIYVDDYFDDDEFVYDLHKISMLGKKEMFILCMDKEYKFRRYANVPYMMGRIINIPKSLYLLELLLRGRIDLIGDNDITTQLSLFDINYIDTIDINMLKNICEYELVNQSYDSIIDRVDKGNNVIGKVKNLVRK